jgi:predicted transposase/invertase (TIGR01784 family)
MAMDKIDNAHDGFFKRVFANEENIRSFLKIALPEKILNLLDLSRIELDTTGYTSEKLKGYRSDIVAKTVMRSAAIFCLIPIAGILMRPAMRLWEIMCFC